jgi:hypothetical protein
VTTTIIITMPAIAPLVATAAVAIANLQPGTCVADVDSVLPILSTPCLSTKYLLVTVPAQQTILQSLSQYATGCGAAFTRVGYTDGNGRYTEGWVPSEAVECYDDTDDNDSDDVMDDNDTLDADDIVDDRRRDVNMARPANGTLLNTQLCSAWATSRGGALKACGATATYDADADDMCDKAGKFCQVFCCDFKDDKAEFAALVSALNTTVAEVKKHVQSCQTWANKTGGPAKACGTAARFEFDDSEFCDAKGVFCKAVCCDDTTDMADDVMDDVMDNDRDTPDADDIMDNDRDTPDADDDKDDILDSRIALALA